jgi:hypothetical protein
VAVHGLREAFSRARNTISSFVLRTLFDLWQHGFAANLAGTCPGHGFIPLANSQAARDAV